jgi:hypothetical protein
MSEETGEEFGEEKPTVASFFDGRRNRLGQREDGGRDSSSHGRGEREGG